ncbi:hypothetical protein TCE0_041f14123 [Talaromyces pinophilus]|uniref:Trichothecene 3-O-acetyltransferase-like N-terminal domain-containing protein n=1 Tax=Talaromyces pinophilus TaxID=128442 RepID=A0A6V8HIC6_TALPI|nr:hypothetical protein TCE0_041f14123 [Talaromyces pinophilus]
MNAPEEIHIPLTPFDHIVPRAYFNAAFYFPLKSGVTPTEAFKYLHEALHRTFICLPWLSGTVCAQSPDTRGWRPGQAEIRYNPVIPIDDPWPHQLKFQELSDDYDISYDDLKDSGFPVDAFRDQDLVWCPSFFADADQNPDVFVAQANFIPGCCIVTAAVCHLASDQTAFTQIFKLWADNCSALQRQSNQILDLPAESSDRGLIERLWNKECKVKDAADVDPMTWMSVGLIPGDMEYDPPDMSPSVQQEKAPKILKASVFYVSRAKFTELRKETAKEASTVSGISGNDALCALIWRCLLRARLAARKATSEEDEEVGVANLAMVGDARLNFASGLPPTFLGNITYLARSSLPVSKLTSRNNDNSSIGSVAATIRSNVENIDSTKLLDIYTLLRSMPDFDRFGKWKRARAPSIYSLDMEITSMIPFPLADISFGDVIFGNKGMVEAMRPLMDGINQFTYLCLVLPRNRNGGVEFVANMSDQEKGFLEEDEEFGRYVMALN